MQHVRVPLVVRDNLGLTTGPSKLSTTFFGPCSQGVIASKVIKAGTAICREDDTFILGKLNDPCVDLTAVLNVKSEEDIYAELRRLYVEYELNDKVNCIPVTCPTGNFYVTTRKVAAGEELLRAYGREAWVYEMCSLISRDTVHIFAYWVWEIVGEMTVEDPKLLALAEELRPYLQS